MPSKTPPGNSSPVISQRRSSGAAQVPSSAGSDTQPDSSGEIVGAALRHADPESESASKGRTQTALLVASPGGHLAELVDLARRLPGVENAVWMTPDTPQSRQLLGRERWLRIPDVGPRDVRALAHAAAVARRLLRRESFDIALSTGAGLALAVLPQVSVRGTHCHYVESAARVSGPSLTGRLLTPVPGVRLWTQYEWNVDARWAYLGSVFDQFKVMSRQASTYRPLRVVVTVGTMHGFSFRRLLDHVRAILPPDADVTWQIGSLDIARKVGVRAWIPPSELQELMTNADVVIAHAGVGSALGAMRAGAFPILVPRRAFHDEHIDDHQGQIGGHLASLGLAFCAEVEQLTPELVKAASHLRLERVECPRPLIELSAQRVKQ